MNSKIIRHLEIYSVNIFIEIELKSFYIDTTFKFVSPNFIQI